MKLTTGEKKVLTQRYYHGEAVSAILADTGIPRSTLYHWIKQYKPLLSTTADHPITHKEYLDFKRRADKQGKILEVIQKTGYAPSMPLEEKIAWYHRLEKDFSSHVLCEALRISRGTYHKRIIKNDNPTYSQNRKELIAPLVKKIFDESQQRFGSDKIQAVLKSRGYSVSKKYVLKLMHEMDLESIAMQAKRIHKFLNPKKNVVKRQFAPTAPNQLWVSDITCFKVKNQRFYICAILDLFSRKILAYSISNNQSTQLITRTFKSAIATRKHGTNLVFHSDQGSQYTSTSFRKLLASYSITQSFSNPGSPHDNAAMESFFSLLKREELYRRNYKSERDFRESVAAYMEFYNHKRPHRYNQYRTPMQAENGQ